MGSTEKNNCVEIKNIMGLEIVQLRLLVFFLQGTFFSVPLVLCLVAIFVSFVFGRIDMSKEEKVLETKFSTFPVKSLIRCLRGIVGGV